MDENDFILGRHERAIDELSHDVKDVKAAVGRIEAALAETRGERRVKMWMLTTASATLGSLITLGSKLALHI